MAAIKHRAPEEQLSEDEAVRLLRELGFEEDRLLQVLEGAEESARARRARLEHFWEQGRLRKQLEQGRTSKPQPPQPSDDKAVHDARHSAHHSRHSRAQPKARLQDKVAQAMQPYLFLDGQSQMRRREVVGAKAAGEDMDEEHAAQVLRGCGFSTGIIDRWLKQGCIVREARRACIQHNHTERGHDLGQGTSSRGGLEAAVHAMTLDTRHGMASPGNCSSADSKPHARRHQVVEIRHGGLWTEKPQDSPATAQPDRPAGPDSVPDASHPQPRPSSREVARQALEREKQRLRAERDCALRMLRE